MSHELAWYQQAFDKLAKADILLLFLLFGVCFAYLVRPYLERKRSAVAAGILVAALGCMIWLITNSGSSISTSFVCLAAFLLMYAMERKKPLQKIFLCIIFLTLRYLCNAIFAELGFFSMWYELNIGSVSKYLEPDMFILLYALERLLTASATFVTFCVMIHYMHKSYQRNDELSLTELLLLSIPTLSPLLESAVFRKYLMVYSLGIENGYINESIPPDIVRFLFYVFSYFAVIMVIRLYERSRREQEEEALLQTVNNEISLVKQSIKQAEHHFEEDRKLRHDINNHLSVMEKLTEAGNSYEAGKYLERMKDEYAVSTDKIHCGDPVLDVVLNTKRDEALALGMEFLCEFAYPRASGIDVFDLSVLLNNALDNAIRGAGTKQPRIKLSSHCRENFMTIIVTNSFSGAKLALDQDGIPASTKEEGGHGLGLKLIQGVAKRYNGDIEFIAKDNEVELLILLQHGAI